MIQEHKLTAKTMRPYTGNGGFYVCRLLDELSTIRLVNFVHEHRLAVLSDKDVFELHCTVIYSPSSPLNNDNDINVNVLPVAARLTEFRVWGGHDGDGYLVACLYSPQLESLHRLWKTRGGHHTFDEFVPHVTLQSPFEPDNGTKRAIQAANAHLTTHPIILRMDKEVVEDAKPQL